MFVGAVAKYVELEQEHVAASKRPVGLAPSSLFLSIVREAEKSSRVAGASLQT